jgi:hypothetical protein
MVKGCLSWKTITDEVTVHSRAISENVTVVNVFTIFHVIRGLIAGVVIAVYLSLT